MNSAEEIYVIGHKNPDTDSICSALSYAYLKNAMTHSSRYIARRAGQINEETEFVLKYFGVEPPAYIPSVGNQVSDMTIEDTEGAPADVTVRIAWEYMKESGTVTLPVLDENNAIQGLITVNDIADYFMDSYSKTILAEAKTKFYDIAETVNGTVVAGNDHGCLTDGKVLVGAATSEKLAEMMGPDDLVIMSDRKDTQKAAIENGASCIVVCLSSSLCSPAIIWSRAGTRCAASSGSGGRSGCIRSACFCSARCCFAQRARRCALKTCETPSSR